MSTIWVTRPRRFSKATCRPLASAQSLIEDAGNLLAVRDSLKVLSLENPAQSLLLQTLGLQDSGMGVGGGPSHGTVARWHAAIR